MTRKLKIMQLADAMSLAFPGNLGVNMAAAELRRLARVEEQRDALLEALRDMVSDHASLSAATLAFARAAIAKAEE